MYRKDIQGDIEVVIELIDLYMFTWTLLERPNYMYHEYLYYKRNSTYWLNHPSKNIDDQRVSTSRKSRAGRIGGSHHFSSLPLIIIVLGSARRWLDERQLPTSDRVFPIKPAIRTLVSVKAVCLGCDNASGAH